jgi:xanthine/uracil permease
MKNRYAIAALFVIGIALGCFGEFVRPTSAWFGAFVLPGVFLSLFLGIGPHGSVRLFEWGFPLCNGIVYAGIASLALWLHTKISK